MTTDSTDTVIFLFSGNPARISESVGAPTDAQIIPFSEKQLMSVASSIKMLRDIRSVNIIFGSSALEFQRYTAIVAILLLLSGKKRGIIADESGKAIRITTAKTICKIIPQLVIEAISGLFMTARVSFRLFLRS